MLTQHALLDVTMHPGQKTCSLKMNAAFLFFII